MRIFWFCLAVLILQTGIGMAVEQKRQLSGEDLQQRDASYAARAGFTPDGSYWIVVNFANGTRDVYWNNGHASGRDTGTHQVRGDQICVTYRTIYGGKERCYDVYSLGDNKYESRRNGELAGTYFELR